MWFGCAERGLPRVHPLAYHGALVRFPYAFAALAVVLSTHAPHRTDRRSQPRRNLEAEQLWRLTTPAALTTRWTLPRPSRIRLPATRMRVGLSTEDASALYALCAREALPDDCQQLVSRDTTVPMSASVRAFWIDRTEVTVHAFTDCMRIGACPLVTEPTDDAAERGDRPVTFVDRDAARAYCRFQDGRLPTQLEFERAARGTHSRLFPWGSLYNSMASNHGRFGLDPTDASDGYRGLAPVGSYPRGATPEGILDLAGNVAEWVEPDISANSNGNPTGSLTPGVVCGGGYRGGSVSLAGAACRRADPKSNSQDVGFRCVYDQPMGSVARVSIVSRH